MARYAYDVNTTQRYIDVHKQFQGGLKTVDTDDALGAVFLREAENISLSEFGFLEKRYGTYENFKAALSVTDSSLLQGYWEFMGEYIVVAVNGDIYFQLLSTPESTFTKIDTLYKVDGLKYPENIQQHLLATEETDTYIGGIDFFQKTRPMGAVNVANVLYIFTGKYPIYLAEENNTLKAYLFAKEDPNFAEIVVTGHNLLEEDYDNLYYIFKEPLEAPGTLENTSEITIETKENNYLPKLPFAKDGRIDFEVSYDVKDDIKQTFVFNEIQPQLSTLIHEVNLQSVEYRVSGPGATDLSFIQIPSNFIESNSLNNIRGDISENLNSDDFDAFQATGFFEANLNEVAIGAEVVTRVPINYWTPTTEDMPVPDDAPTVFGSTFLNGRKISLKPENEDFLDIKTKDIRIDIHISDNDDTEVSDNHYLTATEIQPGKRLGFLVKDDSGQVLNIEQNNARIRQVLNKYIATDSRQKSLIKKIERLNYNISGTPYPYLRYTLYYQALGALTTQNSNIILFNIDIPFTSNEAQNVEGTGQANLTYTLTGPIFDNIQVQVTRPDGTLFFNKILTFYDDIANVERTLSYAQLTRALPATADQRSALINIAYKPTTTVELHRHDNNSGHSDALIKVYHLGVDLEEVEGKYYFNVPDDVETGNHYEIIFRTTQFGFDLFTTNGSGQPAYLNQLNTSTKFLQMLYTPPNDIDKYFYPPLFSFEQLTGGDVDLASFIPLADYSYTLFEVDNLSQELSSKEILGTDFLKVAIQKGLLSGTYDFRFNFILETDALDVNLNKVVEDTYVFTHIAKDITITEEKLTDYTFFQGDRAHPIWSCNSVLEHFGKLMVFGSEEMPTALFYSFPDRPFYFPSKFYLDFTNEENKPLVNVTPYMNILVAQTEDQTWGIRGNSGLINAPAPYIEFSINNTVGTIAPKSVRPVRNHLFFLSKQGVIALKSLYAADEQYNIDFVDRNIRNIVPQDKDAVGVQYDNQYWLNFPNFGITLRWYIDKKAWVKDTYSAWNDFNGVFKYQVKDGKLEFITLPSRFENEGNLNIYKVGVDYTLPTDLGGIVSTKFETSFLNQNYPFHPKNYKEAKFDFTLQNEYNISRDSIYEMDFAEHIIDGTTHTIDNVKLTKNHRYRIVYNFSDHNIDEDIVSGGDFTGANIPTDVVEGGSFTTAPTILFGALSFSILGAQDLQIESVQIQDNEGDIKDVDFNIYSDNTYDYYVDFLLPNSVDGILDIIVTGEFSSYNDGAIMYDITYDSNLVFYNWVISEDRTLNLDNIESYDESKAELNFDFNGRLGNWVFGSSDFGNKVTAVKTEKLSGRGYNAKVYVEDFSRSKWTMESLGLTYKMKRARSR